MKRLLSLLVTGSLLITPVRAAQTNVESSFPALREPAAFGDVADDIWYADAAGLCYVTGLLNGTGNGNFSPSRSVTIGEAATLAGRIHHILNGGDGTLPEAPEEWGQLTLTRAGGDGRHGGPAHPAGAAPGIYPQDGGRQPLYPHPPGSEGR